jgi:hypothetical protein
LDDRKRRESCEQFNSTKPIAELFNGYFASVFTDHLHNREMTDTDPADPNEAPPQNLDEINISELEVVVALRGLSPDKALGPDGILGDSPCQTT